MQSVSGQSKDDRQKIPKTAHELLEIYCTRWKEQLAIAGVWQKSGFSA
jgi:hypothetical protein